MQKIHAIARAPEASLFFDGARLYWLQEGRDTSWPAYSGKREFWENKLFSVEDQSAGDGNKDKNGGPIPEGTYAVRQNEFQIRDSSLLEVGKQALAKARGKKKGGSWPGNYESWGDYRVWIAAKKLKHPETVGKRKDLAVHGGADPGSDGCIDLVDKMPEFADLFRLYGRDMELRVEYPQ